MEMEIDGCLICDQLFRVADGHVCSGKRPVYIVMEEDFEHDVDAPPGRDECWGVNRTHREIYGY